MGTRLDAFCLCEMGLTSHCLVSFFCLNFAVAILNEASYPSQPSADAPHRLPSTLRATGHEPPHFGPNPTKHDPDPSEQPL